MNTVIVVQHYKRSHVFRNFVQEGLKAGQLVFPVPPRMLTKQRNDIAEMLMHGRDDAGVAFITSGTIGASKLIVRSAESIASESSGVVESLGLRRRSKVLITTPIAHSYGFGIFMACAEVGARTWIADDDNVFTRLIRIRELMRRHHFDVVTGVPFIFRSILRQVTDLKPPHLSLAGGETVPVELMEHWERGIGGPLRQEYGLSEVGVVTIAQVEDPLRSIGRPVADCSVRVRKDELIVQREGNPTSYFLGESPKTFIGLNEVRTGDLGFRDPQGLFYLKGRKDSLMFIGGMNVMPEEVERVFLDSDLIDECVVVGRPKENGSMELVANIVPPVYTRELNDLRAYVQKRLPAYKVPRIVNWSNLPRTASGKVDRSAL